MVTYLPVIALLACPEFFAIFNTSFLFFIYYNNRAKCQILTENVQYYDMSYYFICQFVIFRVKVEKICQNYCVCQKKAVPLQQILKNKHYYDYPSKF